MDMHSNKNRPTSKFYDPTCLSAKLKEENNRLNSLVHSIMTGLFEIHSRVRNLKVLKISKS
jgi:hypothetical protein